MPCRSAATLLPHAIGGIERLANRNDSKTFSYFVSLRRGYIHICSDKSVSPKAKKSRSAGTISDIARSIVMKKSRPGAHCGPAKK